MITEKKDKKYSEPVEEENVTLAEIIENEDDKKILEPVKDVKSGMVVGYVIPKVAYARKEPKSGSEIVLFLKQGEKVVIDLDKSTGDYYKNSVGYVLKTDIAVD